MFVSMFSSAHVARAETPVITDAVAQVRALRINPKLFSRGVPLHALQELEVPDVH